MPTEGWNVEHPIALHNAKGKALALALSLVAYEVEYQTVANNNGRGYKCGKAVLLWITWEGERWTFSYHAPNGDLVYDYLNTLREFDSMSEANQAMAGLVWALNGGHGEYPK
jgi:hypothetical protein